MTVPRAWPLQQAVYARLVDVLATAGPGGGPVPVHDHARHDAPRVFVRLGAGQVVEDGAKNAGRARHVVRVHAFIRPEGDADHGVGQREAKTLQALIHAALHGWRPFAGDAAMRHRDSEISADEDGLTRHALSTFTIHLGD